MNNVLVGIGVLLIAVLGALFAVPHVVDFNRYRGVFEEEASRVLGREVRVGGAVNLRLLPTPYVSFEKVRIADTTATLGEPIFKAESFRMWLSVPPLLRGVVEANEVEVNAPVIRLVLDNKGGGSWQSLALGNATYLPKEVALQSVRITDGLIAIHNENGDERTRVEKISGELASPAIEGPYRFRGTYGAGATLRDIRLSTSRPEPDGSIRFKSQIKTLENNALYTLDARLIDGLQQPRIEGEILGQIPMTGSAATTAKSAKPAGGEPAAELRAGIKADTGGLQLSDLAITLEQGREPQIITGTAKATFGDRIAITTDLNAKWLDLDRLSGGASGQGPIAGAHRFLGDLHRLVPTGGTTRSTFAIEQAVLGGDSISNVKASIGRIGDQLVIDELSAGLPGASRGDIRGVVTGVGDATTLQGRVTVRGASIARFANWFTGKQALFDATNDGGFGVVGDLVGVNGAIEARNLVGELAGTALTGDVAYVWTGRRALTAQLIGPKLDITPFLTQRLTIAQLLAQASGAASLGTAPQVTVQQAAIPPLDTKISLRTGELIAPGRRYRNVAAEIEFNSGVMRVPLLQLEGDGGASLEIDGDLQPDTVGRKGTIRAVATAATTAALALITELLDLPPDLARTAERLPAALPLRLAGTLKLAAAEKTTSELVIDGDLASTRLSATVRLDGTPQNWRAVPLDAAITLAGPEASRILAAVTGLDSGALAKSKDAHTIRLNVTGNAKSRLAVNGLAEGANLKLALAGSIEPEAREPALTGDLTVTTSDGGRLAALLPGLSRIALATTPIAGAARVVIGPNRTEFHDISAKVGASMVAGALRSEAAGTATRIDGNLKVSTLRVAHLLAPLLLQRSEAASQAAAILSGQSVIWPDEQLDLAVLDAVSGGVRLDIDRLDLGAGAELANAVLNLALAKDRFELRTLDGRGLGGTWTGAMKLERQPAGTALSGLLRLTNGAIGSLVRDATDKATATGQASGLLTFAGRGLSPRAIVASLTGSGSIDTGAIRFSSLTPATIRAAANDVLKADAELMFERLQETLKSQSGANAMTMTPRRIAVEFADGLLKLAPVTIESADGKIAADAHLDLQSLRVQSNWRIETTAKIEGRSGKAADPLPAVTLAYAGPVAALGRIEPRITSDALARELSVRRIERDVEELERLRRLDEERARDDAERRRAEDAARKAAEEAARQSALSPPVEVLGPQSPGANQARTQPLEQPVIPPFVTAPPVPAAEAPAFNPPDPGTPLPQIIRPPQRAPPQPQQKLRPLSAEEIKRLFGGGGGG